MRLCGASSLSLEGSSKKKKEKENASCAPAEDRLHRLNKEGNANKQDERPNNNDDDDDNNNNKKKTR